MIDGNRKPTLAEDPKHGFSSDAPRNSGIILIGPHAAQTEARTVVITGLPRGGTTMAAQCLALMGVPMGVKLPPPRHNFEDKAFQALLQMEEPGPIDMPRLRDLIKSRNDAHPVWGFKLPMAINSLPVLDRELRNPRYILVFRDVVAVGSREVMSAGIEALFAMRRGLALQARMLKFSETSNSPCMLMSYEKALLAPATVVDQITRWCGLTPTEQQREQACSVVRPDDPIYVSREDLTETQPWP